MKFKELEIGDKFKFCPDSETVFQKFTMDSFCIETKSAGDSLRVFNFVRPETVLSPETEVIKAVEAGRRKDENPIPRNSCWP